MADRVTGWARLRRLADAAAFGEILVALLVLAFVFVPILAVGGVIFAVPVCAAAAVWIAREVYFAITGRELRSTALGDRDALPPVRLGRPISQRRPDIDI